MKLLCLLLLAVSLLADEKVALWTKGHSVRVYHVKEEISDVTIKSLREARGVDAVWRSFTTSRYSVVIRCAEAFTWKEVEPGILKALKVDKAVEKKDGKKL